MSMTKIPNEQHLRIPKSSLVLILVKMIILENDIFHDSLFQSLLVGKNGVS